MNICFFCNTPYHMLNMVNYIYHHQEQNTFFDVYLPAWAPNVNAYIERLEREHLINRIYRVIPAKFNSDNPFFIRMQLIASRRFPERYLRKRIQPWGVHNIYDQIFLPYGQDFGAIIANFNPKAQILYYEDGTSSYLGTLGEFHFSPIVKLLLRLLSRRKTDILPEAIYLNNPDFCVYRKYKKICSLPSLADPNDPVFPVLRRVFDYRPPEDYRQRKCIYLEQPVSELAADSDSTAKAIREILSRYADHCIMRPHPRMHADADTNFFVDTSRTNWELLCADTITSEYTLVGVFSTAQIVPKMLLDHEPRLIILYRLYGDKIAPDLRSSCEEFCQLLKDKYRDKSKIMIPTSLDEFQNCLDQIFFTE